MVAGGRGRSSTAHARPTTSTSSSSGLLAGEAHRPRCRRPRHLPRRGGRRGGRRRPPVGAPGRRRRPPPSPVGAPRRPGRGPGVGGRGARAGRDAADGARGCRCGRGTCRASGACPRRAARAWLKVVPPFFAHEGAILHGPPTRNGCPRCSPPTAPARCSPTSPARTSTASAATACRPMIDLLVDLQIAWVGRVDDLLALGLPDWRRDAAHRRRSPSLVERWRARLRGGRGARASTACWPACRSRWDQIESCGLPDTLRPRRLPPGQPAVGGPWPPRAPRLGRLRHRPPDARPARVPRAAVARGSAGGTGGVDAPLAPARSPAATPTGPRPCSRPSVRLRQALIYQVFLDGIEARRAASTTSRIRQSG